MKNGYYFPGCSYWGRYQTQRFDGEQTEYRIKSQTVSKFWVRCRFYLMPYKWKFVTTLWGIQTIFYHKNREEGITKQRHVRFINPYFTSNARGDIFSSLLRRISDYWLRLSDTVAYRFSASLTGLSTLKYLHEPSQMLHDFCT